MEYLDRVLKEVLRCYSFVPILARTLTEDVEIGKCFKKFKLLKIKIFLFILDGVVLPKGCNLTIDLYDLHHDPDHYPDPYKFDPDRFLPEVVAKRHPYAYVPFSAGPRNCLGEDFEISPKTISTNSNICYIFRSKVRNEEHQDSPREHFKEV